MDEPVDPLLHWKLQKEVVEMGARRFAETLEMYFKNGYQDGYLAGQEPVVDRMERWAILAQEYQRNKAVAEDPAVFPGDAKRAQDAVFEEKQLRQELFGVS